MKSVAFADAPLREDGNDLLKVPFFVTIGVGLLLCWLLVLGAAPYETLLPCFDGQLTTRIYFLVSFIATSLLIFFLKAVFSTRAGMFGLYVLAFLSATASMMILVIYHSSQDTSIISAFPYIYHVLAGICGSCTFLLWEEHFSLMTTQESVQLALAAACVLAGMLFFFVSLLQSHYTSIALACFPVLSLLIYQASKKRVVGIQPKKHVDSGNMSEGRRRFVTEACVGAVCMLVAGFTSWYMANGLLDTSEFSSFTLCVISLILGGSFGIALLAGVDNSVAYLLTGLMSPIMAIGAVFLCQGSISLVFLGMLMMWVLATNCMIVHIANVAKGARIYFRFHIGEPSLILAFDMLVFFVGFYLGYSGESFQGLWVDPVGCLIVLAVIFVLRIICERMLNPASGRTYWHKGNENDSKKLESSFRQHVLVEEDIESSCDTGNGIEEILAMITQKYGLSPRETEVLEFLARGHNARSISEKLYVTVATVKSHSHNIYSKTKTHSQQELIDMVEQALRKV